MTTTMDDPRTWPLADVLPVRRAVAGELWPELGVLLPERGPVVFLANAAEPGLPRRLAGCERLSYPTFAALRADGWVID